MYGSLPENEVNVEDPSVPKFRSSQESSASLRARKVVQATSFFIGLCLLTLFAVTLRNDKLESSFNGLLKFDEEAATEEICTTTDNRLKCCTDTSVAVLSGIDVVAYTKIPLGSKAVMGSPDITYALETKNGKFIFQFSTEENKEDFVADPWKFIPELGGFDANALAGGMGFEGVYETASKDVVGPTVDVNEWTIIHDKLYLFGDPMGLRWFTLQQKSLVSTADKTWLGWFDSRWVTRFSPVSNTVLNTQCVVANELPVYVAPEPVDGAEKSFMKYSEAGPIEQSVAVPDYDYEVPEYILMDQCTSDEEKRARTLCCGTTDYPVLGGADVVEFYNLDEETPPVWGNKDIVGQLTTSAGTYDFWFSSEENKALFDQDPWKYAPIFGGFCSFGIAKEKQYDREDAAQMIGPFADFPAWSIYEDHVYMFGGKGPRKFFLEDPEDAIASGAARWESWYDGELFDGIFNTKCFSKSMSGKKK
mmetsp:Transcript_26042/g.44906  ORF Transcript_26042/g.44906 Transcript_26042/m.44906 type:complete len:477 (-) Transcript_26042:319-1749(-)